MQINISKGTFSVHWFTKMSRKYCDFLHNFQAFLAQIRYSDHSDARNKLVTAFHQKAQV